MKLIVGLGNPGKEYEKTRHNVGFMILDNYLGDVNWQDKFNSFFYKKGDVLFLKPKTYMNLSGNAILACMNYYNINISEILIIHDDLDIEIGTYRIKTNSGSGGHNGLKSIIQCIGSQEFNRLKVGISKNNLIPTDKYVLSKFTKSELDIIQKNYSTYNKIIEKFINYDINYVLNNQE